MKKGIGAIIVALVIVVAAVAFLASRRDAVDNSNRPLTSQTQTANTTHSSARAARVPAHFNDALSARPLNATLDPELFAGKAREAYIVAKKIPETLAQLPCYCYCDQSIGHKSLHSCYEDEHSATCSTCIEEALLAYKLQTEQGMTPPQVRAEIVSRFSR